MSVSSRSGRPWLAAVLGAVLPGSGHLYLRRWKRAVLWIALAYVTNVFFIPPAAAEAFIAGELPRLRTLLPVAAVTALSALDAYVLAVADRAKSTVEPAEEAGGLECPRCGKQTDVELGFCQWCSLDFERLTVEEVTDE
ncbi:zinc ribbon domain-containing protein [Salinirubellus salinus]|uniref:Zinc ribbon domain-containing protein n=1 Tax=Salinirubellus salinus TaxID=1364945 RepID=A0A9E7QZ90_9EURY|nr:DUF6677 family protein [Salinirubellus salinus]UWM52769.1 zinc ribbon domain-containing protein [Salinirubellus salinus]